MSKLTEYFGVTDEIISDVTMASTSGLAKMLGDLSERNLCVNILGIDWVEAKVRDHDKTLEGDILFPWKGRDILIEVKNLVKPAAEKGEMKACISTSSKWYEYGEHRQQFSSPAKGKYDILAVCLWTLTRTWEYRFYLASEIPTWKGNEHFWAGRIDMSIHPGHTDIFELFDLVGPRYKNPWKLCSK